MESGRRVVCAIRSVVNARSLVRPYHVERMENDRIAKRFYVGECASIRSVSRPRKRWNDTLKDCLKKRGLDVKEVRRMIGLLRGCI